MPYYQQHETDPLLGNDGHESDRTDRRHQYARYLRAEIDPKGGDLLLLFCYLLTGLLDSAAVFIWGSFVSMQTGNTVYLGLGLAGLDAQNRWIKALISISCFCLGSLSFAMYHRSFGARQRWVLASSFLTQMACIAAAASITSLHPPGQNDDLTWKTILPLSLVAFQSSGQAVISRVLDYKGLTSVVLTSVYCDLFSHAAFKPETLFTDPEEFRRLGAVLCLLLGTFLGGLWAQSNAGLAGALWTAVACKGFISLAWLFWKETEKTLPDEE